MFRQPTHVLALLSAMLVLAHGGLAPSLKPAPAVLVNSKPLDPDAVVRFTKNLYKDLGKDWGNNATVVADKYRDKFARLNATTEGQLGNTLASLFEIRMLDLQSSIKHARKMRSVIESFAEIPAPPADI
jgi:hypothetical protein